jgi:hypothetical protein
MGQHNGYNKDKKVGTALKLNLGRVIEKRLSKDEKKA